MAGVCFYFEDEDVDVWSGKDLDAWNYACMAAGDIDELVVIDRSRNGAPRSPGRQYNYRTVTSLEEANLQGVIAQVVCPWNGFPTISLWDFDHKVDWYVFGPAAGWRGQAYGDVNVTIPMAGMGAPHSVHAATAVLMHRYQAIS